MFDFFYLKLYFCEQRNGFKCGLFTALKLSESCWWGTETLQSRENKIKITVKYFCPRLQRNTNKQNDNNEKETDIMNVSPCLLEYKTLELPALVCSHFQKLLLRGETENSVLLFYLNRNPTLH